MAASGSRHCPAPVRSREYVQFLAQKGRCPRSRVSVELRVCAKAGADAKHLLPILGFSIFSQNRPSCSFIPFILVCPEVFSPWKSKAGMSHPLSIHIPSASSLSPGSGVTAGASGGTTFSPESSDAELGKNNLPGWLLLPSFAGGWS